MRLLGAANGGVSTMHAVCTLDYTFTGCNYWSDLNKLINYKNLTKPLSTIANHWLRSWCVSANNTEVRRLRMCLITNSKALSKRNKSMLRFQNCLHRKRRSIYYHLKQQLKHIDYIYIYIYSALI